MGTIMVTVPTNLGPYFFARMQAWMGEYLENVLGLEC